MRQEDAEVFIRDEPAGEELGHAASARRARLDRGPKTDLSGDEPAYGTLENRHPYAGTRHVRANRGRGPALRRRHA